MLGGQGWATDSSRVCGGVARKATCPQEHSDRVACSPVNETDEGRFTFVPADEEDYFILIRDVANDDVVSMHFPDHRQFAAACEKLGINVVHEV